MDTLGSIHVVFGLCALVIGTLVVLIRKGTRFHRAIGHGYFASMLGLNVTALLIYRLTGNFNFFHAAALFKLDVHFYRHRLGGFTAAQEADGWNVMLTSWADRMLVWWRLRLQK